jgi:phage baseplate assembly protein W
MKPIGLVLPLTRGNAGFFDQSYDTLTQIKSNIINLLRTNSGERRMQPQFSSGLQEYLFEQNLEETPEILKKVIQDRINLWIPGVIVKNVDLKFTDSEKNNFKDTYKVYIKVEFIVNNQSDSVNVELTQNNV